VRGLLAVAVIALFLRVFLPVGRAAEPARPFPVRMVKLGGPLKDPSTAEHVAYCRKVGFNAIFVYSHAVGRWTKESARFGPVVDREFIRFARQCHADGIDLWVSLNPVADSGGHFVFSDPDGLRRILAFAGKLRRQAGITNFILSFDDQPVVLREFQDIVRYGRSSAPAHLDLARRVAAGLPEGLGLWLCAAAYCDAHLGDGTLPYAKALLEGLAVVPASVGVVWTGPRVLSPTITAASVAATRARLGGRRMLLYDNFPTNDDDSHDALALILGALRGREPGVRDQVAAYLACPMTELGGSRLSLATTAAFLADPEGYDPDAAMKREVDALVGNDRDLFQALHTQQLEWGGFIDARNYWPREALNAESAGKRLDDPAFVESFTWTADRYPGRMAELSKLSDLPFRDDLLRAMRRRLVVARALPLVREYDARKRAGRADADEVLVQLEAERRRTAPDPDASRVLDAFLRAAGVPTS
jgi:hypothetical protein